MQKMMIDVWWSGKCARTVFYETKQQQNNNIEKTLHESSTFNQMNVFFHE